MLAEDSLRQGNPRESLAQLQAEVRKHPAKVEYRIFLFQLLALLGEWGRALNQLNVVGDMDAGSEAMVQTYREALRCERLRQEVFAGRNTPLVFGEPADWVAWQVEALHVEDPNQASELRMRALEAAPASAGRVDVQVFNWIADADSRLGPILEAIVNGNYYWIPLMRISAITFDEPEDLRDAIWMPAHFTWANGGQAAGLVPTRYPGSENADDGLIQLARQTEWTQLDGDLYRGLGQRMFATDADDYPLMDVRQITLDQPHANASN
jgi:type VI secretion system protein ImpE